MRPLARAHVCSAARMLASLRRDAGFASLRRSHPCSRRSRSRIQQLPADGRTRRAGFAASATRGEAKRLARTSYQIRNIPRSSSDPALRSPWRREGLLVDLPYAALSIIDLHIIQGPTAARAQHSRGAAELQEPQSRKSRRAESFETSNVCSPAWRVEGGCPG